MKEKLKYIFLIGGYDLEMLEIKKILESEKDVLFFDKQLEWDAKLSDYEDILQSYGNKDDVEIYGIELSEDSCIPKNYHRIDHHNDFSSKLSSLEQIAELLHISLSSEQQLIAANDRGYIPEMLKLGATQEEINQIRFREREAQGVTKEDEQKAEKAIENKKIEQEIIIVKPETNRFSPITDRLFPYEKLLIYTDNELMYYGVGKEQLLTKYQSEIDSGKMYHGGGENGFIGTVANIFSEKEIEGLKDAIIQTLKNYSYHIFYFPFQWELTDKKDKFFSERTDLKNIRFEKDFSNWLYKPNPLNKREADELYNEKNFYYKFVHPVLYDTGEPDSILMHFERKEPQVSDISYKIALRGDKTYILKMEAINLNLYATGVGMLTFFLKNERDDQKSPSDILKINQYGRRIFPPFIADVNIRSEIAESLSIEGLYGNPNRYKENFTTYTNENSWTPSCFIKNLIGDLSESIEITPVIDDRMFVNCWYGNDKLATSVQSKSDFVEKDDFWYKYLYVDVEDPSCKNKKMRKELLNNQTYKRWQEDGMLYGSSRFSFVFLSKNIDFHKDVFAVYMRTVYSRMIELILIQRASILKFSDEITNVSKLKEDKAMIPKITSLYESYIRFVNQVYFREISSQDQAIELYRMMLKTLNIEHQIKDLDNEIEELHQYVSLLDDRKRNKNAEKLNMIAAIFLPATLIAGIFGMNSLEKGDIIPSFFGQLAIVIGGSLLASIFLLKLKK